MCSELSVWSIKAESQSWGFADANEVLQGFRMSERQEEALVFASYRLFMFQKCIGPLSVAEWVKNSSIEKASLLCV